MMHALATDRRTIVEKVCAALRDAGEDPAMPIRVEDHLVDDLGFDSTSIAVLTITLEDVFDEMLLLNEWIAAASSPSDLTVASLVDYVASVLADPS